MRTFVAVLLCLLVFNGFLCAGEARLGINLQSPRDYEPNNMFADAMKSSRPWGSVATPWDMAAAVDANGWPTADAAVVVKTGAQYRDIGGTYKLSFTGSATVRGVASTVTVQNQDYNAATNATTADVIVDPQNVQIMLSFTNTIGGVRNVKLMRPGYTNETFTREFLALIQPFALMRSMWMTETIDSNVVEWSDRTLPSHASQNRRINGQWTGVAWEYVAELANLTGKDLWVNVPDQASDDYVRQLAAFLKNNIRPEIPIYVEYSNETWNFGYRECQRNFDAAQAEVAAGNSPLNYDGQTNPGYLGWRRVGKKTRDISEVFRSVFGDAQMMTRVRPLLAMQHDNPMSIRQPIEFLDAVYGPPSNYLYGISSAPYFGPDLATRQRTDLTVDEIIADLNTALPREISVANGYVTWARYYRIKYVAYEAGPFLDGAASLSAKIAASRDTRMQEIVVSYLNQFAQCGGDDMAFFTSISGDSQYGIFGLTDDVNTVDTPKFRGIRQWLAGLRPAVTAGVALPGRIAAGQFDLQSGFVISGQASVQAGANVWYNYLIRVPANGTYNIVPNISTLADGAQLQVLVDAEPLTTWAVPNTRGVQNWTDLSPVAVNLSAGQHVVRIRGVAGTTNVRFITTDAVNLPLTFISSPTIAPNPPVAGSAASFMAAASGNGVTLTWNFGDATPLVTADAPVHTFTAAGAFAVTVTASDLLGNTLSNTLQIIVAEAVNPPDGGGGNGGSTETGPGATGLPIAGPGGGGDAPKTPFLDDGGAAGGVLMPLNVTALQGIAHLSISGHDQCVVFGNFPNLPSASVRGLVVTVAMGSESVSFTLDKTGKAKAHGNSFSLKLPRKNAVSAPVPYKLTLKNATLSDGDQLPAMLDIRITLGTAEYEASVDVSSTQQGQVARFKK